MGGVVYTAEVTLKNVPQDYKSSGAGAMGNEQLHDKRGSGRQSNCE